MISLEDITLSPELKQVISPAQAWHYRIVPKSTEGSTITFYTDGSCPEHLLTEELELLLQKRIITERLEKDIIQQALSIHYRRSEQRPGIINALPQSDDFLQHLIAEAKTLGSSDIHIEAYEEKNRVRMRIDGHLIERYSISKDDYPRIVNKIKIKSNLDIAEKRLPQDGRIFFQHEGMKFDIRVSILPALHGEKVVMRLLNNDASDIEIARLGFSEKELENYLEGIKRPNGILLISGPTGSGKTTTLYATLKLLNKVNSNIVTIEDPIEYTLRGINQVQLKESIGLTFASALRTFLRQDPDIIMLGEIRDAETAQMAIRAALTGHLVLSTIHTNSAWGIVSRLTDMGVPPFLIASTLNTAVAQRLLRTLCPKCKEKTTFHNRLLPKNYKPAGKLSEYFVAKGCDHCHYTGYKGRNAIYEVIPISYELSAEIRNRNLQIGPYLEEAGIRSLSESAYELFKKGETSIEEVYPLLMNET